MLVNRGRGLEVGELELFRDDWGYDQDEVEAPDARPDGSVELADEGDSADDGSGTLITSDLLRRVPLGRIVAKAQAVLSQDSWRDEGIVVFMGPNRAPDELTTADVGALENAAQAAADTRRGRPELSDELVADVARAYLNEMAGDA